MMEMLYNQTPELDDLYLNQQKMLIQPLFGFRIRT